MLSHVKDDQRSSPLRLSPLSSPLNLHPPYIQTSANPIFSIFTSTMICDETKRGAHIASKSYCCHVLSQYSLFSYDLVRLTCSKITTTWNIFTDDITFFPLRKNIYSNVQTAFMKTENIFCTLLRKLQLSPNYLPPNKSCREQKISFSIKISGSLVSTNPK